MAFETYGGVRAELRAQGLTWEVNPNFPDDQPITRRPLGALLDRFPRGNEVEPVDIRALVNARPPGNPLLRNHLIQTGLLAATGGAAPAAGGAPPTSVDWRNRFGWPWITQIRDQDPCEHCWIYAATALIEAMVRIEHCVWSPRSEGDYIEANAVPCGQCGSPGPVLDWVKANGMIDLDGLAWSDRTGEDRSGAYFNPAPSSCGTGSMAAPPTWAPPRNRSGRTVRTPGYTSLGSVSDQKNWLNSVGPLVVGFDVYDDFYGWHGNTPYQKSANAQYQGGHVMLAVGYDDNLQCWIVKNSWGTAFGNSGYYLIGYGQCGIDSYAKLGLQGVNPDPWVKRRLHSGGMIESGDGAFHRNFELVARGAGDSWVHWWRDNSSPAMPWVKAEVLAGDIAESPTLTGSTYNRNFELVYSTTGGRLHHWWFDQSAGHWNDGGVFGPASAQGPVGFVESRYGPGNFEVVAGLGNGTAQHWWRDPSFVWHPGPTLGSRIATVGRSLIESTWNNLEFVATNSDGTLQHWWRSDGSTWAWNAGPVFAAHASGPACMIQGQFGASDEYHAGNFELVVAGTDGTVQHWWRDNQNQALPWHQSAVFGSGVSNVVSLVEGSYGFNLEVVVERTDGNLQHYWRDGAGWHVGAIIGPTS